MTRRKSWKFNLMVLFLLLIVSGACRRQVPPPPPPPPPPPAPAPPPRPLTEDEIFQRKTLAEMKANAKLKNFDLVRLARLSVMPVSDGQWKIMEGMVRR